MSQVEIQAYQAALELSYHNALTNLFIAVGVLVVSFGVMIYIVSRDSKGVR